MKIYGLPASLAFLVAAFAWGCQEQGPLPSAPADVRIQATTHSSPSDFSAAATRIKLESILGSTFEAPVGNLLASSGVLFTGGHGGDFSSDGCAQVDVAGGFDGTTPTASDGPGGNNSVPITNEIIVELVTPLAGTPGATTAFGTYVGSLQAEVTMNAFDLGGNLVGTVTSPTSNRNSAFPVGDFLVLSSATGIHKVVLTNGASTDAFVMGDFFVTSNFPVFPSCTFSDDFMFEPFFVEVSIDIKPGSDPNCFNNNGHGVIPVAILGSATFDVTQVDPSTVQLESLAIKAVGKSGKLLAHIEDVNSDGFDDLVVQIEDVDGTFTSGSGTATLSGELFDGTPIEGSDAICVVP